MMKRITAIILAVLMLSGCQLARQEVRETPMEDKLVGVFVTFEPLDLDFDIEGYLNDHPGVLSGGEVTLDPGEGMEYAQRLSVTVADGDWLVPGHEGIGVGRYWNGEYWTGFSGEGICELNSNIADGEDGAVIRVEGTVFFPDGSDVELCANPVYQTGEGEFYVIQGNSFHSHLEKDGSMSHSVKDEKTWTENGTETGYSAEFTTTVRAVTPAEQVALVWMTEDHRPLGREEYLPGQLPETLTPAEGAAYLIVEEISGEGTVRSLCQPGGEMLTVYYRGQQPWCLPETVQILWEE